VIGAIAGDIIGSAYEFNPIKTKDFPLFHSECTFTDDSVLTIALAEAILEGKPYSKTAREWALRYRDAGYGIMFLDWLETNDAVPYDSYGNGAAMRVSPVGFAFTRRQDVLREAARSAEFSHNHPEGIKGAQATALSVYLARTGTTKKEIRSEIAKTFGYDLDRTLSDIRPDYGFDETCQGTVPEAIIAFLESESWEDAVRNAVSLGGDSDTLACITGGIAEAFYGPVPPHVRGKVKETLRDELWKITERFCKTYMKAGRK
jgi:ADP-ribosylglycohydrolase